MVVRGSKVGAWAVAAACVAVATPVLVTGPASADNKVTICHRTHSTTNPYRRISVSISAVNGSGGNDHTHHWGALFDPAYAYPANAKVWGDIIPVGNGGQTGVNWTAAGQAMYSSARCGVMTPQAFYNSEREAGVEKSVILADLKEQGADGDPAPATFDAMTYTGTTAGVTDTTPAPVITVATDPAQNPSATPSPSTSSSPTSSPSASASASASPSDSPSPSASTSPSDSPSPSFTPSPSASSRWRSHRAPRCGRSTSPRPG